MEVGSGGGKRVRGGKKDSINSKEGIMEKWGPVLGQKGIKDLRGSRAVGGDGRVRDFLGKESGT